MRTIHSWPSARPRNPASMGLPGKVAPAHRSVELRDGAVRVVAVADTHGRPHPESSARIRAEKPDCILHAGDIGDLGVLSELEKIAPVFAVRGNIDAPVRDIPEALILDLTDPNGPPIRILLVHIALFGPKLRGDVAALARRAGASLVICGHSHVPFIGSDKGLGAFNPGSIGPRRFQLPVVFGVMDVVCQDLQMRHVDCETGQTWRP